MAMKDIEDRFNRHYRYPWTFLNNENFTTDFIEQTTRMASGRVTHGLIPAEHWSVPSFIDDARFRENMERLGKRRVIYGDVESYHHMCRYNSGFFWRAAQLAEYDWYWRVEPGTNFFCDQLYDPFTFMRENGKRYSFVIAMYEFRLTIETLWDSTREFARLRPGLVAKENTLGFLVDDLVPGEGSAFDKDYNLCHFWSNFEIGDLNLWRSEAYREYFDFLDRKGGFFYERWGDAPVHSIAAALFLSKDQIHFWSDIGYRHPPYERCPQDDGGIDTARCICPFAKEESFDFDGYSCQKRWWRLNGEELHGYLGDFWIHADDIGRPGREG